MRRAFAIAERVSALPRGWTILGLALAAWALVVLAAQLASSLFSLVVSSL